MTSCRRSSRCRAGFTLIELLAVIAIIALLMSIALPSVRHAVMLARKSSTAETLSAIEKGLSVFRNEFDEYPNSARRPDPVTGWSDPDGPGPLIRPPDGAILNGAHWLARVLVGHDFRGLDAKRQSLGDTPVTVASLEDASRKDFYIDDHDIIVRDDDPRFKGGGGPATGRPVVVDAFGYPILYFRANKLAKVPFGNDPAGTFVYNQNDNADMLQWDFAAKGVPHPLATFGGLSPNVGDPDYVDNHPDPTDEETYSFTGRFYSHSAHEAGGVIKPVNETKFILLSPGDDGLYGTGDDVFNF